MSYVTGLSEIKGHIIRRQKKLTTEEELSGIFNVRQLVRVLLFWQEILIRYLRVVGLSHPIE
jgi:hypothetical protein